MTKLQQVRAKAKAKIEKAQDAAKEAKEALAAAKDRFRKWRSKNPDHEASLEYTSMMASKVSPKIKEQQLNDLLSRFVNEISRVHDESMVKVVAEKASSSTSTRTTEASFMDICGLYAMDPWGPETSDRLQSLREAGLLRRRPLKGKDLKRVEDAKLPAAAAFRAELSCARCVHRVRPGFCTIHAFVQKTVCTLCRLCLRIVCRARFVALKGAPEPVFGKRRPL